MISFRPTGYAAIAILALLLIPASGAYGQRQPASPEQRIDRLERQIEQMQRQVFPKGRPADTAGFAGDPAASQSAVTSLDQRLDALERQMSDILRLSEENGHMLRTVQSSVAKAKDDSDERLRAIERRLAQGIATVPSQTADSADPPVATAGKPKPVPVLVRKPDSDEAATVAAADGDDAGEIAYTEGFKAWQAGRYDEAITSLRAFVSAYPKHRRASFARNLIGRSLLDKGEPGPAAQALLANYRGDPKGERAPDSLLYLGQSLIKLGQPAQACKAYSELDAVYGSKIRPELKQLEDNAKLEAKC